MKKSLQTIISRYTALFLFVMLIACPVAGQVPGGFNYQAVLRNLFGEPMANETVSIQIVILQGSATGSEVYTETHSVSTNEFGLVNLEVGSENPTSFSAIDWAGGPYFIKIMVNGSEMGTSQLLSVPYAMHAGTVDTEKQQLSLDGKDLSISGGNTVTLPAEEQQLSVTGEQVSISGGNTVNLPTEYANLSVSSALGIGTHSFAVNDAIRMTGTTDPTANSVYMELPSGFSASTSQVLTVEIYKTTGVIPTTFTTYYGLGYTGTNGTVGYYLSWSSLVIFGHNNSGITIFYPDELKNLPFRIVLLKVTIP
jgi:hypothetical protein